ncbi:MULTISPECIES: hypothetical protein [Legionella]|uniref:Guanylate cyclase domain-containing protein n=1 Tax=Legionella maceachernii TaxID=466 RepID=A0A0W0WC58_9GAMM|nr:hypothetical protein [Legionella maceachernii]KTD29822.1 hypothetical protein Lmac_0766 [Legionella maceachernii]SJZ78658.1 Adenylate and Guanylate cyclase catalytic domain-containing protein [Legionella maceachernii]SUP02962.1 Uncharacterised protein [Legionella maceachernii]
MKSFFLNSLAYLVYFVRIVILLFVFLLLIAFISQFVENISQYPTLVKINKLEQQLSGPLIQQIKMAMPHRYQGTDYSRLILIFLMLILGHFCVMARSRLQGLVQRIHEKETYYQWRKQVSTVVSKEKMHEIDSKFEALSTSKASDRKKILKEFALLKSKLDSMGQQLAFLAIDVVDSTGMKRNEDKYVAAYDFDRYNQLVSSSLKESGVLKYAMTPDGIMSCFRTVDDAVRAAQNLLDKLKVFNATSKKIKRDFQIRCGINAGFVYFDEDTPLEQVSDRVIDIAGHMQKYAKPNCINIAASAIEPLKNRGGFSETNDVIDEQKVFEWNLNK